MRWEYFEPEAKVFIYQEGIFEQYYAEDNQLIRSRLTGEESGAEILVLLAGEKKLRSSYAVEAGPDPATLKNALSLKLTPLREGEFSSILVEVDDQTSLPVRLVFTDLAGNRTEFLFKKARADMNLPSRTFSLKVPQDCEIIDELPPSPKKDV
jgi:outer membrane lipoprotein-sorting protein